MDNRIKKHAEVLLKYSLDLKKGEKIVIVGDVVTLDITNTHRTIQISIE